jgi:hypothetical protein
LKKGKEQEMKVKIKKWNGVAVWKWEIDEEVSQIILVFFLCVSIF